MTTALDSRVWWKFQELPKGSRLKTKTRCETRKSINLHLRILDKKSSLTNKRRLPSENISHIYEVQPVIGSGSFQKLNAVAYTTVTVNKFNSASASHSRGSPISDSNRSSSQRSNVAINPTISSTKLIVQHRWLWLQQLSLFHTGHPNFQSSPSCYIQWR